MRRCVADEAGTALVLALVVVLILALVTGGIAQLLTAETDMGQLMLQDAKALYLAQAGLEHQIYLLKGDKDAPGISPTEYPDTGDDRFWYSTTRTCLSPPSVCTAEEPARRWCILSVGEIRRNGTPVHTRVIRAEVEIAYQGTAPPYGPPLKATVLRWEEDLRVSPTCP
ncbi:MAG: hypothetical protein QN168_13645 [Armatimonadota bacterium]|nr:hypothetical protein [Armatimonadota bacterium]